MNFYAYCGNNPVNLVDPWGWCPEKTKEELIKKLGSKEAYEEMQAGGNTERLFWDPITQIIFWEAFTGKGTGKLWRSDGPGHGLGPHDHIGPWRTGPKSPGWGNQKWPGWIEWIKQGGGWKWPWN